MDGGARERIDVIVAVENLGGGAGKRCPQYRQRRASRFYALLLRAIACGAWVTGHEAGGWGSDLRQPRRRACPDARWLRRRGPMTGADAGSTSPRA